MMVIIEEEPPPYGVVEAVNVESGAIGRLGTTGTTDTTGVTKTGETPNGPNGPNGANGANGVETEDDTKDNDDNDNDYDNDDHKWWVRGQKYFCKMSPIIPIIFFIWCLIIGIFGWEMYLICVYIVLTIYGGIFIYFVIPEMVYDLVYCKKWKKEKPPLIFVHFKILAIVVFVVLVCLGVDVDVDI